jgi:hypothetical protein
MVGVPVYVFSLVGAHIHRIAGHLGALVGIEVGIFLLRFILPGYFIYNPEGTAYLANNPWAIQKGNVPYGPNMHLSLPWEKRNKSFSWPLSIQTDTFEVSVQTKTSEVSVVGEFGWSISLARLNRFVTITSPSSTIKEGVAGYISSFLSAYYAGMDTEEVRKSVSKTNEDLCEEFMATNMPSNFEARFGIVVSILYIRMVKLPARVQKTRDARDEANQLLEVVAELYGITVGELKLRRADGTISHKEFNEMLNRAMATSDNASMDIRVIEVQGVDPGMGAILGNLGGGNDNRRNRGGK